jgi:hypothetical protein
MNPRSRVTIDDDVANRAVKFGTPVSEDYKVPFKFTGKLEKVTINITEEKLTEEELERYRQGRVKSAIAQ